MWLSIEGEFFDGLGGSFEQSGLTYGLVLVYRMYSAVGRPSIAPEKLLRTCAGGSSQGHHVVNAANPRSAFYDGIEHWLHVRRRATDDAEHLGRCRLMFQRLAQFCVALLDLFEKPHVFDGDHRLIGEGFEKLNLPFSERPDLHPTNHDCTDRDAFAEQRCGQHGAKAEPIHGDLGLWKLVIGLSR